MSDVNGTCGVQSRGACSQQGPSEVVCPSSCSALQQPRELSVDRWWELCTQTFAAAGCLSIAAEGLSYDVGGLNNGSDDNGKPSGDFLA